jgi:hypothetical protein
MNYGYLRKVYEWRVRDLYDGNGVDNDFNDPTIGGLQRAKESFDATKTAIAAWKAAGKPLDGSFPTLVVDDGEHDIEISLYLRLGNEECGVVDSGEAWIRDGVLEAKFDYLDNEIPARYYKQVERVFGKPQPHAPKKK